MTLEPASKKDYAQIRCIYNQAFPKEERAPFWLVWRRTRQGRAQMLAARENGVLVGFANVVVYEDMAYLFYFAITAEHRGEGYGSRILQQLMQYYAGKRFFLAREQLDEAANNYDQRMKRHVFYRKNGLEDMPLSIKEAGVIYDVMGTGGRVAPAEYDALITSWSGGFLRRLIDMRMMEKSDEAASAK